MRSLAITVPEANQNPPDPPEPVLDWIEFGKHHADEANDVDDGFLDGRAGDVLNVLVRIADYLDRGNVAQARMLATFWRFQIDQNRETALDRHAGTFPAA